MSLCSTSSQELFSDIPESTAGKSRRKSCLSDLRGKENMENGVPEASSSTKRRRSAPSRAGLLAPKKRKSSSAIKLQKRASEDHFHLENSGEQATIMVRCPIDFALGGSLGAATYALPAYRMSWSMSWRVPVKRARYRFVAGAPTIWPSFAPIRTRPSSSGLAVCATAFFNCSTASLKMRWWR